MKLTYFRQHKMALSGSLSSLPIISLQDGGGNYECQVIPIIYRDFSPTSPDLRRQNSFFNDYRFVGYCNKTSFCSKNFTITIYCQKAWKLTKTTQSHHRFCAFFLWVYWASPEGTAEIVIYSEETVNFIAYNTFVALRSRKPAFCKWWNSASPPDFSA